ncbi:MAG: hypothetical protein Ct9H300mP28_18350 [Pseudomonadota bacterium]|nr:MAG: hypothetical protein Ct9H300mP28_18350 [Pseudomonadota bacterium]
MNFFPALRPSVKCLKKNRKFFPDRFLVKSFENLIGGIENKRHPELLNIFSGIIKDWSIWPKREPGLQTQAKEIAKDWSLIISIDSRDTEH